MNRAFWPKFAVLLSFFIAQAQCQSQPPKKPATNEMQKMETNNIPKLVVTFDTDGKTLEVDYRVKNTTGSAIYLFNVIRHTDEIETVSPYKFYTCLRDDGTVFLGKVIPNLPSVASVEVRDIPYVTKVEAGKEFSEKVELPLPLEEYNPYFQKNADSKVEPRVAERIFLAVDFIREKKGLEIKETKIPNAFSVSHDKLFESVETLSSNPSPIQIKVNRRLDKFERF